MDISIIIINTNEKHFLEPLLNSIKENVNSVAYEVIVVDNNSSDGSPEMIRERCEDVKLVEMDHNGGFSKSNNRGARIAQGKYLVILNPDTIVCKNALESMFEFLERENSVAVVGCKLLNPDGSLQRSCGIFPNLKTEFYFRTFLNRIFPKSKLVGSYLLGSWDYSSTAEVDWVTGACLMIRKDLFDQLGGFDERLYMYYEDVDLCYRVRELGWKIYFIPNSFIYHYLGGSWKKNRAIPIFNGCRSSLYFFRKHRRPWQTWVLKTTMFLEIFLFYLALLPFSILTREDNAVMKTRLNGYNMSLKFLIADTFNLPKREAKAHKAPEISTSVNFKNH
jgi:hypothetical protein